jgi:hypothetical protein
LKNDTDWHKGGGGGPKLSKKLTRIIWMAPLQVFNNIPGDQDLQGLQDLAIKIIRS